MPDGRGQFAFNEIRHFAGAFADQADDYDIGVNALQYLAHQHRLSDARAGNNRDALTFANCQQRVDGAHAGIHRADDTAPVKRVAIFTSDFLSATA